MKKIISVLLSVCLVLGFVPFSASAAGAVCDDYIITNPYENVNWD